MTGAIKLKISGLLIALGVIIADQLSKWYVVTQFFDDTPRMDLIPWLMQKGEQLAYHSVSITSFLNMVMVWNPGVSFGMLQTNKAYVTYGLTIMALLVSLGFMVWLWRDPKPWRAISIGMIVGGALGNVWDRLRFGAVADFIDIHVMGYHWPAFNIADAAITMGIVIILIETLFFSSEKPAASGSTL